MSAAPPQRRGRGRPKQQQAITDDAQRAQLVEQAGAWSEPAAIRVDWTDTRIQAVLDYFDERPNIRHQLFSDSVDNAKKQGRSQISTAKTSKIRFYDDCAKVVLGADSDPKYRAASLLHLRKFATSMQQLISGRLRKQYREVNDDLGRTGAGLSVEDVLKDPILENKIRTSRRDFPFWRQLHGWWVTLPNFNPYTTTSDQAQNHTKAAVEATGYYGGARLASQPADPDADAEGEPDEDFPANPLDPVRCIAHYIIVLTQTMFCSLLLILRRPCLWTGLLRLHRHLLSSAPRRMRQKPST
ncbi:hypothetical protein BD626DRAFT_413020 [Schizophyllum amplum]|uniref:Uncharacterized protein n=1 Tax=Schizophyllum amplum TaxID=97359 RepID=A0A550BWB7_9AGAR|nr:hypothetical protein BD626DRAFT_413020 [Auriculariopsis ampla]